MIKIITDTAANLPQHVIDQYGITIVSGYVSFGGKRSLEYPDLSNEEFYAWLAESDTLPLYEEPSAEAYTDAYQRLSTQYPDAMLLVIGVSAKLARTLNAARAGAARIPDANIRIFDTASVSIAEGLMVCEAARLAQQGISLDAIMARLADMRENTSIYFTLDTLDYLAMSGRVNTLTHIVGSMLNVKPVLTVREGEIVPYAQQFSRDRALRALRDMALDGGYGRNGVRLAIGHAMRAYDAYWLLREFENALDTEFTLLTEIGPGVGTHTGPRAMGVCWYTPNR